jgi:peptidoglycan/xylan/chitin deacetylase (PgdA/CDA1 family)
MRMKKLHRLSSFLCLVVLFWGMLSVAGTVYEETVEEVSVQNSNSIFNLADGTQEHPKVAITFDDGPSWKYTPKLLDGLKERGVTATFFLIGDNIEVNDNAEIVKRMADEGHLIGSHTYHHVKLTELSTSEACDEITQTNELIQSITGKTVEYMRPPFGLWKKDIEKYIDVIPVLWSNDPLDWANENVDEIVEKVVTKTRENDIILLHDNYDSSVEAALRIIDILAEQGYEFVTVDELLMD